MGADGAWVGDARLGTADADGPEDGVALPQAEASNATTMASQTTAGALGLRGDPRWDMGRIVARDHECLDSPDPISLS